MPGNGNNENNVNNEIIENNGLGADHPEREDVLVWYNSMLESLKDADIDINNPGDLMRVRIMKFNEPKNTEGVGCPDQYNGRKYFAFMPKTLDGQSGQIKGYQNGNPPYPPADVQERLYEQKMQYDNAFNSSLNAALALEKAYSKPETTPDEIGRLEKAYKDSIKARQAAFQRYRKQSNDSLKDYNSWVHRNNKVFETDNPEDYSQIEAMYNAAMHGELYVNLTDNVPENKMQILVMPDKSARLDRNGLDNRIGENSHSYVHKAVLNYKRGRVEDIPEWQRSIFSEKLAQFENANGIIDESEEFTEEQPQTPAPVEKPGAWSWFKRIITFNINRSDFTRYDQYTAAQRQYEQVDLPGYNDRKQACRERNLARFQKIDRFITENKEAFRINLPEGLQNTAEVNNNNLRIAQAEMAIPQDGDFEPGIESLGMIPVLARTDLYMKAEGHENPESFNPQTGEFDPAASERYWSRKGELMSKENSDTIAKIENKIAVKKEAWIKAKYNLSAQTHEMLKEDIKKNKEAERSDISFEAEVKKNIKKISKDIDDESTVLEINGYSKKQVAEMAEKFVNLNANEITKKIAGLFPELSSGNDPFSFGIKALAYCLTHNQAYLGHGKSKFDVIKSNKSFMRTSEEIIKDMDCLIDVAEHPEKAASYGEQYKDLMNRMNTLLSLPAGSEPKLEMMVDSGSSVLGSIMAEKGKENMLFDKTSLYVSNILGRGIEHIKKTYKEEHPEVSQDDLEEKSLTENNFLSGKIDGMKPCSMQAERLLVSEINSDYKLLKTRMGELPKMAKDLKKMEKALITDPEPEELTIKRPAETGILPRL